MKKLFAVTETSAGIDTAILFTRIAVSVLMLIHGLPKMAMLFSDGAIMFPPVFGLTPLLSLSLAVFAEVLCSILILVGFGTRLAVLPLAFTMLVALFVIHANDPFSNKELALHYLITYLFLLITGSGKFSLDYAFRPTIKNRKSAAVRIEDPTLSIYQ